MAKSRFQKLKLLYIKDYFERCSDDSHGIPVPELIEHLSSLGIEAERKSIYDDIELLSEYYGMNIEKVKIPRSMEYRLTEHDFDLHELKLLCDAVMASRFITEKKSDMLIDKLKAQASVHEAQKLSRQVIVSDKIKNMNESIYYNVDAIFEAIAAERSVRFRYFARSFRSPLERCYRRGGEYYEVSPYALTYSEEKYYLIAYDYEQKKLKHFRVDRMEDIREGERGRDAQKYFSSINLGMYTDRCFGMFGGEETRVTLEFEEFLAGAVYDRFGSDIVAVRTEQDRYRVHVPIVESEQFYGWLAGLGSGARVIAPDSVREGYKKHLCKILESVEDK